MKKIFLLTTIGSVLLTAIIQNSNAMHNPTKTIMAIVVDPGDIPTIAQPPYQMGQKRSFEQSEIESNGNRPTKQLRLNESSNQQDPLKVSTQLSQQKRYACTIAGCTKSFPKKKNLKKHEITHTSERPFKCPIAGCNKSFTQRGSLKRHEETIHLK